MLNLNSVIERLEARGLKCKLEKSQVNQPEVVYVGHRISKDGIQPLKEKIDYLRENPAPKNIGELVSFLGAVNYYRRYLPNLATVIAPLDNLRQKGVKWTWTNLEQSAFDKLKELLCSRTVLTLYDPSLPLKLDTDASSVGLGAVLSHVFPDGSERPLEYISRTLSPAERRYAQIDREALAIIWAVKRFHIYLYGRHFSLVTDHKALTFIFGSNKCIPEMSASRITRWAIFLMNYDFEIKYRNTKDHGNADMLSRLPRSVQHCKERDECADMFSLSMEEALLDATLIAKELKRDPILSKVLSYILEGWPEHLSETADLNSYWVRRKELSVELGCIVWGNRVVIPPKLRDWVLQLLHSTHVGMVGMKSLARNFVWFPGIDAKIEETVKRCESCAKFGKSLPKLEDHPWARPTSPFQRVHIDFCEYKNIMWLVLQCAYSKWPEVIRMNSNTTSSATIKALRLIFARTGLPMTLVSDNGPQLVSEEIETFFKRNGINHVTVPTYSPKSNGLCERFVGTFKSSMKKMAETCLDLEKNTANFLLTYRNTPHSATGQPPAVLAFNRTLRFNLHQIKPADRQKREELQAKKEQQVINSQQNERSFEAGQSVYVQLGTEKTWLPARVVKRYDPQSNVYDINCNGRIVKKHADRMKAAPEPQITSEQSLPSSQPAVSLPVRTSSTIGPSLEDSCMGPLPSTKVESPEKVTLDHGVEKGLDKICTRPTRQAKLNAIVKMKGMT